MSDQGTNDPTWMPPAPPQPGAVMAPPPPPPAPGAFMAPPGRPAPKRRNVGLIIGIVAGVLMLCVLASCGLGLAAFGGGNDETVSQAESHYSAATAGISEAADLVKAASEGEGDSAKESLGRAADKLRASRDEIAAARGSIERLDESDGKAAYLASLDSAVKTLESLEDLVAYLSTANGMMAQAGRGAELASKATDDLNAAIRAGNADSWSKMRSRAMASSTGFAQAAVLFAEADKADPSAGLSEAVAYIKKRKAQADVVVKMADDGRARRVSTYNKRIKTMRAYGEQAEAIGEPTMVSDPDWVRERLAKLYDAAMTDGAKADELHGTALKLLGYDAD